MTLYVKRPVVVKNVVTENFKQQMIEELGNAIKQIEIRLGQMEFRGRRMIAEIGKTDQRKVSSLQEELNQEREKQRQLKEELEYKLAEIEKLQIDQIFISGVYDSPVKIEVGDKIMEKLSQAEIIVKDGVVIQIRE
ncbi:MAG: YlqD family protein [Candidatus Poribacteria bacterium]